MFLKKIVTIFSGLLLTACTSNAEQMLEGKWIGKENGQQFVYIFNSNEKNCVFIAGEEKITINFNLRKISDVELVLLDESDNDERNSIKILFVDSDTFIENPQFKNPTVFKRVK